MTSILLLEHQSLPRWLLRFLKNPDEALDQLLRGEVYLEESDAADPGDILIDWVERYSDELGFRETLDAALARWIEKSWTAPPPLPEDELVWADAWIRACNAVAYIEVLEASATALRRRFDERDKRLGPLSYGRSRDPLGRYLFAIAQHQKDRELIPLWLRLCELGPSVPLHHGVYGVEGVRRAPGSSGNGIPADVVNALLTLADGLGTAVALGRISEETAHDEWFSFVNVIVGQYTDVALWEEQLARAAMEDHRPSLRWLRELSGTPEEIVQKVEISAVHPSWTDQELAWAARANELDSALAGSEWSRIGEVEKLIADELAYASLTGRSTPLVLSLVRFSRRIEVHDPSSADKWCAEARRWQPWNPYPWVVGMRARRWLSPADAAELGWSAVLRFPDNALAHRELGAALIVSNSLVEAEALLLRATEKFPENPFIVDALSDTLMKQGRVGEAMEVWRERDSLPDASALYERRLQLIEAWEKTHAVQGCAEGDAGVHITTPEATTVRARTLRHASRSMGPIALERASAVLTAANGNAKNDPVLGAEHILLTMARDGLDAAKSALRANPLPRRHAAVAHLELRLWRKEAELDERSYSSEPLLELRGLSDDLREIDPELMPLAQLASLRSIAALSDSGARAEDLLGRAQLLEKWTDTARRRPTVAGSPVDDDATMLRRASVSPNREAGRAFLRWWAERVDELVLEATLTNGGSVDALEGALGTHADALDAVEEDFAARVTVAP